MSVKEVVVFIPSHSLEDFPTELPEAQAAGLLNAFSVAWHPSLLAATAKLPQWSRADDPTTEVAEKLFIVPEAVNDWLQHGWTDAARSDGAQVVEGLNDRAEMIAAVTENVEIPEALDSDLVADFIAIGTCYLQIELLTRHMHYFSNIDESLIEREAVAAAEAALNGDREAAEKHLRACAESLLDARERFYPVDCYLLDLCLIVPSVVDENLEAMLASGQACNLLISGADVEEIASQNADLTSKIADAWADGRVSIIGGERDELPVPTVPLESFLLDFQQGSEVYNKHFRQTPKTWARRRFGFTTLLPQVLKKHGFHSALHIALDDGIYPDQEQSKIQWEGCDGTVIDAISRIPLAGDSAASFLRLPMRMAETMEQDHVAAIAMARWPELKTPWMSDLHRVHRYAPALGRLVTFDEFFDQTDSPGRLSTFNEDEYLSPFFVQLVACEHKDGVTRFQRHFLRHAKLQSTQWLAQLGRVLAAQPPEDQTELIAETEKFGPDSDEDPSDLDSRLSQLESESMKTLSSIFGGGQESAEHPGLLAVNTRSFARETVVPIPASEGVPRNGDSVIAAQRDGDAWQTVIRIPEAGFTWIPLDGDAGELESQEFVPMGLENVIRNEFFEVHVSARTGGIEQVKEYGRKPNRLSQQIAFRFPAEKVIPGTSDSEDQEEERTFYSRMLCTDLGITSVGPAYGEIVSRGQIVDDSDKLILADFVQTIRVWKGRRTFDLKIELEPHHKPVGSPWATYFASRFAWNDPAAALTRSVLEMAHPAGTDRIESPHFLEIASESERTTILPRGLSFHRKTGMRMVDTILLCENETATSFEMAVAIDNPYPMSAAWDVMSPVPTWIGPGPSTSGQSGWLFRLRQKNVQLTRLIRRPTSNGEPDDGSTFIARLIETEGVSRPVTFEAFRTPTRARKLDLRGEEIGTCTIEDGSVRVVMDGFEICDLELQFT